jgi:4-alpha-glucanotransferase
VGEDLGTVERGLRAKLAKRDVAGMSVAVFDLSDAPARRLRPRPGSVAYVDTHDTATFAAWFDGSDIKLRADLGLLNPAQAAAERATRQSARDALVHRLVPSATAGARARERGSGSSAGGIRGASRARGLGAGGDRAPLNRVEALDVLGAVLAELGASDAYLVLVAVEDLWAELDPQNVPGTTLQHANFSRRLAHRVEELAMDERACALLATLDTARRTDPRRAN